MSKKYQNYFNQCYLNNLIKNAKTTNPNKKIALPLKIASLSLNEDALPNIIKMKNKAHTPIMIETSENEAPLA